MNHDVLETALQKLKAEIDRTDPARIAVQGNSPAAETCKRLALRIDKEPSVRTKIDDACRQFAGGRQWPFCDPDTTIFYWDRVCSAYGLAFWLHQSGFRGPDISLEKFLELLLVDYWNQAGVCGWKSTLMDMQRLCQK